VYGISVDSTWAHDAWRSTLGLPGGLVLLSDFNRDFGNAYGLCYTNSSGMRDVLRRCVLIVSSDGKLAYRWDVPEPPRLPSANEVLDALRATRARYSTREAD
jgi:peroxiredoxin